MNDHAITFDFHNTLAACPEWFDLEVKHLPSSFLRWWSASRGVSLPVDMLDEADASYRRLRQAIMDHGMELTAEASLKSVFANLDVNVPEHDISEGVAVLMRETLAGTTPIPGAIETVSSIHDAGITIGVVSSAVYHPFLEWALDMFGIRHAIRDVVTSASAGYYKSRPEIYRIAATRLGAAPSKIVHVGDSLRFDVGGARRAGMGTVWLQHRPAREDEAEFVPDLTLQTLERSAPAILGALEARINGDGAVSG
jgi:HAD superfamily hydrolase (TIGR01509 family)